MQKEYSAKFSNDLLLLATFKLAADNNAMLKILNENLIEIRSQLTNIETWVEKDDEQSEILKTQMLLVYEEAKTNARLIINDLLESENDKSMIAAYEWAFVHDPESTDLSGLGI